MKIAEKLDFDDIRLRYNISREELEDAFKRKSFDNLKSLFEDVGIHMDIKGSDLVLSVFPADYLKKRCRGAGRRRAVAWKHNGIEAYRFSDVVYLMQDNKDNQIISILDMAQATYYRHKKNLYLSEYYKKLDPERVSDIEYLKSVDGDLIF
ncbi:MAG: hypothetical protein J5829_02365 [Lachnospiraceae bacterium]|nr:hypothetical protein [Lachnospiraceae bacterium]